jgi:hypothetical protein
MNVRRQSALLALVAVPSAHCGLFDDLALTPQTPDIEFPDVTPDIDVEVPLPIFPDGFGGVGLIGPDGLPLSGESIGGTCAADTECRTNLVCSGGACAGAGATPELGPCLATDECAAGLICGPLARCQAEGAAEENGVCSDPFGCQRGLRCNIYGFTGICEPEGTADIGQVCASDSECAAPLGCGSDGVCRLAILGGIQFMPPNTCEASDDTAAFAAFFEFPDESEETPYDFYRLPFPNDAHIDASGNIDLSRHHNPGASYLGGDVLGGYLTALEDTFDGFSINPTVLMRFTRTPDYNTIVPQGDGQTLYFINIDENAGEARGQSVLRSWQAANTSQTFICQDWLAVRGGWESPLLPDTTYAVYLTDGVRAADGSLPERQPDLQAVLGSTAPSDARLGAAWNRYAEFRDYLAVNNINPLNIIGATVFTTSSPTETTGFLRDTVRSGAPPAFDDLTLCEAGATSPCDDGSPGRACLNVGGDFIEVHGTYEAPILQRGTRPYFTSEDGGDLVFNTAEEQFVVHGTETMCFSMSIPRGPMPADGWPVVMYGHGTGGTFTSHLRDVAGSLASIEVEAVGSTDGSGEGSGDPAGPRTVQFVSIGIDGVQHGPRRGDSERSTLDPENLFYNFLNPLAARGNIQQGAADYFTLMYALENLEIAAADFPTGETFMVDPGQIYFYGHSQGSQVGAPFAAFEPNINAAVFSGAGAGLSLSLLSKSSPVDIASGVRLLLASGNQAAAANVNTNDPLLSILQWYIDPVDSLSYTPLLVERINAERGGMHVLQTFGFGDTYSPEDTLWAFGAAAGLRQAATSNLIRPGYPTSEYPITLNRNRGENGSWTAVIVAGTPPSSGGVPTYDGHFIAFRDESVRRQVMEFLGTMVVNGVPSISAP